MRGLVKYFRVTARMCGTTEYSQGARDAMTEAADKLEATLAAQPGAGDVLPSEAVFAFAASLTCRPGVMEIGSTSDAAPMAELAAAFCEKYGFDPCRDHFPKMLTAAQGGGDGS